MVDAVDVRDHYKAAMNFLKKQAIIRGRMLEIGASIGNNAKDLFEKFEYVNLDIEPNNSLPTIVGDITDCTTIIPDNSFDFIFSKDTFEHVAEPWKAAKEVIRILKPGGLFYLVTVWSWRYHPVPIDFWRFSPECLAYLFNGLRCLDKNFDCHQRRWDMRGFWKDKKDAVPIDNLGGWIENWRVFYVGVKEKMIEKHDDN